MPVVVIHGITGLVLQGTNPERTQDCTCRSSSELERVR